MVIMTGMSEKSPTEKYPLAELSLAQMIREWKRQRRLKFQELSKAGKTYEEIGKIYGITRQAVGQIIHSE